MDTSTPTLKQRAFHEFKEFLIIALYLWVVFGLLVLHKSMILAEHHIDFTYHGLALINALALAKVMLVARHLPLGEQLNNTPLIYPTLLKSALFTVVLATGSAMGWHSTENRRPAFSIAERNTLAISDVMLASSVGS